MFGPYPGDVFEALVRLQYERLKNLLYPTPRDATFARTPDQLLETLDPKLAGRLIVVDGTQEEVELPVPAEFELLHEHRLGASGRVRFWLLRRMGE